MPLLDHIIGPVNMKEDLVKGQEERGRERDRMSLAEVGGRASEKEGETENPGGRYITPYLQPSCSFRAIILKRAAERAHTLHCRRRQLTLSVLSPFCSPSPVPLILFKGSSGCKYMQMIMRGKGNEPVIYTPF